MTEDNTKHTQGPWVSKWPDVITDFGIFTEEDDNGEQTLVAQAYGYTTGQQRANARLIAAAPKRHSDFLRMMEALKNIQADAIACQFGIKEGLITDIYRASKYLESIERLAETAIAKAEENDQ